ncbi:hypothetical protein Vafri_15929, partial [Volvox africanus]
ARVRQLGLLAIQYIQQPRCHISTYCVTQQQQQQQQQRVRDVTVQHLCNKRTTSADPTGEAGGTNSTAYLVVTQEPTRTYTTNSSNSTCTEPAGGGGATQRPVGLSLSWSGVEAICTPGPPD